ncbi:hypothetical protein J6590_074710 [Homalodisca vitripennis]|nr:hypothetical protein J6590_074710 [Homalodisca vitripennis]
MVLSPEYRYAKKILEVLGVSRDRVQILCKTFFEQGTPVDRRGGDTRSRAYSNKREALGTDLDVHEWKKAVCGTPKHGETPAVPDTAKTPANWHFQFMPSKKIILSKSKNPSNSTILVQGEVGYNMDVGAAKSICRKGKSWCQTSPEKINKRVLLKDDKLNDLKSLLAKHYGHDWNLHPNLTFYKGLLSEQEALLQAHEDSEEEADDADEIREDDENVLRV